MPNDRDTPQSGGEQLLRAGAPDGANAEALRRILNSEPVLVGVRPAGELVPPLGECDFLHAGPPLHGWDEACGALRGAVAGTLTHAGLAPDSRQAEAMAASGEINFLSGNDFNVLGTYAGVIGRHTPVLIVENRSSGVVAGAALNEGRGKALRYGANDPEILARLQWLEGEFATNLDKAIQLAGGIDIFALLEQALHMGDDGHSRQKAASCLFLNAIAPFLIESGPKQEVTRALRFMAQNDIFFLPMTMAAAKATMASAEDVAGSTVVTCMAANGARLGIKISGLPARWFTSNVPVMHGRYFSGFSAEDAGPVIGDSEISETMGLGAFAMAGAPALAAYVGGTPEEATRLAMEMYDITLSEHTRFKIPALSYRGTPLGIDARLVVAKGLEPIFNAGIAHRDPGVGQIGAGFARAPSACFQAAVDAMG